MIIAAMMIATACQQDPILDTDPINNEKEVTMQSERDGISPSSGSRVASANSFSVVSYNVAGLPDILSSSNPEQNTPYMGPAIEPYDIINVQEDFNYHAALYASDNHTYRTPTSGGVPFGDGMNTLSYFEFTDFARVKWDDCNGTDCLTPKGFTFTRVRIQPGVYVDLYNAHTNAGSDNASYAARRANITQLSNYIAARSQGNAVIVMGDMNCRYTRNEDNIRDLINVNGLTDTWIEVERNGSYPAQGSGALVCTWPNFNDVTCEVVDKILYKDSKYIDLTPTSYQLDHPDFVTPDGSEPLSDHYPIIVDFNFALNSDFVMSDLFGGPHGTQFSDLDLITTSTSPTSFTIRAGNRVDNISMTLGGVSQLQNRSTGLYLDGMGRTNNGADVSQWANTSHPNSKWTISPVDNGYFQLKNFSTGLFLDGMGRSANGSIAGQYANTNHPNCHWSLQQYDGDYFRVQNRGTGLFLDGLGLTSNGEICGQWANTADNNAQWRLINTSTIAHGGTGGTPNTMILNTGEYVNYVKMCSGKKDGHTRIFYLELKTNQGRVLSGGSQTSNVFTYDVPAGYKLSGFYGNAGSEVDKLGVICNKL